MDRLSPELDASIGERMVLDRLAAKDELAKIIRPPAAPATAGSQSPTDKRSSTASDLCGSNAV